MQENWHKITSFGPEGQIIYLLAVGTVVGIILSKITLLIVRLTLKHEDKLILRAISNRLSSVLYFFLPSTITLFGLYYYQESLKLENPKTITHIFEVLSILSFGWLLIAIIYIMGDVLLVQYDINKDDNLRERKIRTQLTFIKKIAITTISIICISAILMSFESVRKFGQGLLASAGIAGIIIGFAAQKFLANMLAGFQIAFTQPIKIDDALIVEGEWGRVEEINLTYVVVKIWDWRRLVLPITYFVEKPFQNWTRTSARLIGPVFLYTDYSLPTEALRQELRRILEEQPLWDGEVCVLQVTDCKERVMEVRALMSARSGPDAWDLRCIVREKLVQFIQENYPSALPKTRATLESETALNQHHDKPGNHGRLP